MCGIIGVVAARSSRRPPAVADLYAAVAPVAERLGRLPEDLEQLIPALDRAAAELEPVDQAMRGGAGMIALVGDLAGAEEIERLLAQAAAVVDQLDARLDVAAAPAQLEAANAALIRLKDAIWAIRRDRIATAHAVAALAGEQAGAPAIEAYAAIQTALAGIDRLEVRGRDSAGLHVLITGHGLDLGAEPHAEEIRRRGDALFEHGAVRVAGQDLSLVYKAASEIGRLGDNVRVLRSAITADPLLRAAVQSDSARVTVLAHTRWASVGLINQANAHPLTSEEQHANGSGPYVLAALNGDVDNHRQLRRHEELQAPPQITTDAKVIPMLTARRLRGGGDPLEAFRRTVNELEGSVAIAAQVVGSPGQELLLAVRGSGQALYVGTAEDAYVVASEPYGLVESCRQYLRVEGETPAGEDGARGQIVAIGLDAAGGLGPLRRISYAGTELPVGEGDMRRAEITTRDVDLRGYPHFLRKELDEAPQSLRKTLRGRVVEAAAGGLEVNLGPESVPPVLAERLRAGAIRRVLVIGQGTAAVAGAAVAAAIGRALRGQGITATALPATELSGFGLSEDMRDTLVVAISQSGTTTDTNRTVDLLRARGAVVVAIVNRRGSDLTDKADGVLYTSDGRDIEMSVASTKAFYGQVAAGQILALALARAAGCAADRRTQELLAGLRQLPDAMREVLAEDQRIAELAAEHAPRRRYWAVVGNHLERVAAQEIRIKLSELCYKAVACDATEDKKHIDLSSEPLTIICAAGLAGSAADDVAKEIAIFRAHDGVPLVIATRDEDRFEAATGVISVPAADPDLAFVLATMAGHLFGYHAARAIDAQALPLRELRAEVEQAAEEAGRHPAELLARLQPALNEFIDVFEPRMLGGELDGTLEASTGARLLRSLLMARSPATSWPDAAGPGALVDELTAALTAAIDELTRPIDAIKHQAKTVTVGISRADEEVLTVPLVAELLTLGVPRAELPYVVLRTVAALDPAVAAVSGYTRYRIDGSVERDEATITVVDKGGIAASMRSRTEGDPRLRGNKRRVAVDARVLAAVGRSDGRPVLIVPETRGGQTTGLTLLHVEFAQRLSVQQLRQVLEGYHGKLGRLESAITETETSFDADRLAEFSVADLLTEPIEVLADRWSLVERELRTSASEPSR